ncbi:hypothetical protein HMPREF0198_0818 [Cardiobacterium hominis ATCC 15826]|uniref:Uncharacterized protein n=1 Tax=Cardiobacterium hominis (strain ATCC 15826 / DSM 8339 / NCTC 10426 / 6573) TaxID=638300 RepID=C8N8J1_CARH6|nr:hypothetical protein HMPREF0198_0818 [Cardiobacterium hominis ATCC 15826]
MAAQFFTHFNHTAHQTVFPTVRAKSPPLSPEFSQKITTDNCKNPRVTPFFHVDY